MNLKECNSFTGWGILGAGLHLLKVAKVEKSVLIIIFFIGYLREIHEKEGGSTIYLFAQLGKWLIFSRSETASGFCLGRAPREKAGKSVTKECPLPRPTCLPSVSVGKNRSKATVISKLFQLLPLPT